MTQTLQWTHRLGFLVPSGNAVLERDSRLGLPPQVSAHFGRMPITRDDPAQLAALADHAPDAARLLAHAGCQAVLFACTTGSLFEGAGYDEEITRRVTDATGVPASTTATAAVAALRSLGLERVALVTPYEPWLDERVVAFLAAHGIAVTATAGPVLPDPRDTAAMSPERIAACLDDVTGAQGVFVSCTALRGLEAAPLLRERFGLPVVTSNEATFWAALRLVGAAPEAFPGREGLCR